MIGYHYTTKSNWEKIKTYGIVPYLISKPELEEYFPGGVNAVWVWTNNLRGLAHSGSIIWQSQKGEAVIVKLRIKYRKEDVLSYGEATIKLYHDGTIGDLKYHDEAESCLVTKIIPPKDIKLVGEYDLIELLK